jgi:hypothetical protein
VLRVRLPNERAYVEIAAQHQSVPLKSCLWYEDWFPAFRRNLSLPGASDYGSARPPFRQSRPVQDGSNVLAVFTLRPWLSGGLGNSNHEAHREPYVISYMSQATFDLRALRILIVDDEENIRFALTMCLESDGHKVVAVGSIEAALEKTAAQAFDLIFLDVRLGTQNGPGLHSDSVAGESLGANRRHHRLRFHRHRCRSNEARGQRLSFQAV